MIRFKPAKSRAFYSKPCGFLDYIWIPRPIPKILYNLLVKREHLNFNISVFSFLPLGSLNIMIENLFQIYHIQVKPIIDAISKRIYIDLNIVKD